MTNKTSVLPILFIILVFFGCQQYDENVTPEPEDFFISIEDHPEELKTLKEEFSTQNLNKHTKSRYNSTVLVESIDWTKVRKIEYSDYTVYSVNLRQGNFLANNLLLYKKDGQLKSYILQLDSKTTTDASDGLTCENLEGSTLNIYSLDQDISWSSEGTPSQAGSGGRVADDYCYWVDFWVETWVKAETPVGVTYKVSEPMHYSVLECYDDGMGPGGDGGNGSGDPDGYGDLPDDPNPIIPGGKCPQGLVKDIDDNCVSCPPGTVFERQKCVVDIDLWEEEICINSSFSDNPCLMEVWNTMKDQDVGYETLAGFTGDAPKAELCLDLQDLSDSEGDGPNGNAGPSGTLNDATVTITINSERLNRSKLSIARTMLHEMIHAELWGMVIEAGMYEHLEEYANNYEGDDDFMMIWEYYDQYEESIPGWQHEYMADYYIQYIAEGLKELDPYFVAESFRNAANNGYFHYEIGEAWNWDDFYEYMAWEGLHRTEQFQSDIVNADLKSKYDAYRSAFEELNSINLDCSN